MSDTHGTHDIHKLYHLKTDCEIGRARLTKDDYVIVCGDFGLLWNSPYLKDYYGEETWSIESNSNDTLWSTDELELLKWYNSCPWTTLFVDGNHENFDRLKTYPISEWHGGNVQKISDSVIHLMRGEIYEIDGHTYFCMGGAMSTDRGYATGTEKFDIHKWWWPQEIPSSAEWENAYNHLNDVDWKVDFVITHDAPAGITMQTRLGYRTSEVSNRLETIRTSTDFIHWFCGHLHMDRKYGNVSVLYHSIIDVERYLNDGNNSES